MRKEKKKQYFYMAIGYTGLLLLGLAVVRLLNTTDDFLGQSLVFLGLLLVINYIRFIEEKAETTKKESFIGTIILVSLFLIIAFLLYI